MLISLALPRVMDCRAAMELVAEGVQRAPEIGRPPARGLHPRPGISARPPRLIERMTRRQVSALIDHRRLKRFGEFDEVLHARLRNAPRVPRQAPDFRPRPRAWPASMTEPESPCGGASRVSLGMRSEASLAMGASCKALSSTMTTGSLGGVMAILYARTEDSAKCGSEMGGHPIWCSRGPWRRRPGRCGTTPRRGAARWRPGYCQS